MFRELLIMLAKHSWNIYIYIYIYILRWVNTIHVVKTKIFVLQKIFYLFIYF